MNAPRKFIANLYLYDPLDRLVNAHSTQRFYNGTRIATEIQGSEKNSFFEHQGLVLAELQHGEGVKLLATDLERSVLHAVTSGMWQPYAYTAYGHRSRDGDVLNVIGFNGERPDPVTGHYMLGNGYRAFNPALMRFNSPDSWSPFGKGGINAYAYCKGDPVNLVDIDGHMPLAARLITEAFTSAPPLPRRIPLVTRQSRAMEGLMKTPSDLEGLPRGTDYLHGNRIAIPTDNPDIYLDFTFPLERKAVATLREHGITVLPQHRAPLAPPTPARNLPTKRLSSRNSNSGHDNPAFVDSEAPPLPPRLPARNSNLNIENKASSVRKKL